MTNKYIQQLGQPSNIPRSGDNLKIFSKGRVSLAICHCYYVFCDQKGNAKLLCTGEMVDIEKKASLKQKTRLLNGDFQQGPIKGLEFFEPKLKVKI